MRKAFYGNKENVWIRENNEIVCYKVTNTSSISTEEFKYSGTLGVICASLTGLLGLNVLASRIPTFVLLLIIVLFSIIVTRITTVLLLKSGFKGMVRTDYKPVPIVEANEVRRKMIKVVLIATFITLLILLVFLTFRSIRFASGLALGVSAYITGILYDVYDFKKFKN